MVCMVCMGMYSVCMRMFRFWLPEGSEIEIMSTPLSLLGLCANEGCMGTSWPYVGG